MIGVDEMFAIGECKAMVSLSKLPLPKEYHLKNKPIYAVWAGDRVLYISDEINSLRAKAGKNSVFDKVELDYNNRINVPDKLNKKEAVITGCISTIKVEFAK